MLEINFHEIDHRNLIIENRTFTARLIMDWFSLREMVCLQTILIGNSDIKINVGLDEAMSYTLNILNFKCDKEDISGWKINYRLTEEEFVKYIAPRIAELLDEEGL